jgi:hypothetical protein
VRSKRGRFRAAVVRVTSAPADMQVGGAKTPRLYREGTSDSGRTLGKWAYCRPPGKCSMWFARHSG